MHLITEANIITLKTISGKLDGQKPDSVAQVSYGNERCLLLATHRRQTTQGQELTISNLPIFLWHDAVQRV